MRSLVQFKLNISYFDRSICIQHMTLCLLLFAVCQSPLPLLALGDTAANPYYPLGSAIFAACDHARYTAKGHLVTIDPNKFHLMFVDLAIRKSLSHHAFLARFVAVLVYDVALLSNDV
jgi:hypothetical protein